MTTYGTHTPPQDTDGRLAQAFRARYPELQGKRILLFVSRIHEKKGCDLLIDAFADVSRNNPNLHLVMAGPDQTGLESKLKQRAVQLGIKDRITWPGMLQGDEKWGAFHAAEVFCLPSHQENFGIVVAEALACGTPTLISNKVNIWREIEADGVGFVQDDTVEGTITGLRRWLALSDGDRSQMQQESINTFNTRFRIDRVAESLIQIMQRHVLPISDSTPSSIESTS